MNINDYITCFVHWKNGEITEERYNKNDYNIDGITKTFETMKNQIDGLEFFDHETHEITARFF